MGAHRMVESRIGVLAGPAKMGRPEQEMLTMVNVLKIDRHVLSDFRILAYGLNGKVKLKDEEWWQSARRVIRERSNAAVARSWINAATEKPYSDVHVRIVLKAVSSFSNQGLDTTVAFRKAKLALRAEACRSRERAGEMLAKVPRVANRKAGANGKGIYQTFGQIGISHDTAYRWQILASLSEADVRREFVLWWDSQENPSGGRPKKTVTDRLRLEAGKNGLPDRMTISRWRRRLSDDKEFGETLEAAPKPATARRTQTASGRTFTVERLTRARGVYKPETASATSLRPPAESARNTPPPLCRPCQHDAGLDSGLADFLDLLCRQKHRGLSVGRLRLSAMPTPGYSSGTTGSPQPRSRREVSEGTGAGSPSRISPLKKSRIAASAVAFGGI